MAKDCGLRLEASAELEVRDKRLSLERNVEFVGETVRELLIEANEDLVELLWGKSSRGAAVHRVRQRVSLK